MPELPDLVHIVSSLAPEITGLAVTGATVKEPIVLRLLVEGGFSELVSGRRVTELTRQGPFLRFGLSATEPGGLGGDRLDLVMHLMLSGRLRLAALGAKKLPYTAFTLILEGGRELSYADEKRMGKIYLTHSGEFDAIPGYLSQGVDVYGPEFDYARFASLLAGKRCQARVFLMDQSALSAIGNAYADEILFEARIHPKATCSRLGEPARKALFDAIVSVLAWGAAEVEAAGAPLEDKVRGHMRVRNRAGQPCPRCGTTIRKAGVLGFDSFFCPRCQPDSEGKGLDWSKLPGPTSPSTSSPS